MSCLTQCRLPIANGEPCIRAMGHDGPCVPIPSARDTFPVVDEVERLAKLRAAGVTSVTFHETGALASVTFEPAFATASADPEEEQRDPSTPMKRTRRAVGGLVPRGPTST